MVSIYLQLQPEAGSSPADKVADDSFKESPASINVEQTAVINETGKHKHSADKDLTEDLSSPPIKRKKDFYHSPVLVKKETRVTPLEQRSPKTPIKTVIMIDMNKKSSRQVKDGEIDTSSLLQSADSCSFGVHSVTQDKSKSVQNKSGNSPVLENRNGVSDKTFDAVDAGMFIKQEQGENNSDTDSGVGADTEKQIILINNPIPRAARLVTTVATPIVGEHRRKVP